MIERKYSNIYITGHDAPDFDSFVSAYFCTKYFEHFGIAAEVRFFESPDENSAKVLRSLGFDFEKYIGKDEYLEPLFLVDAYESSHGKVIGAIDHHPTEKELGYELYFNEPSSSCALSIFRMLESVGAPVTSEDLLLALYSVYMDTLSLQNSKFLPSDMEFIERAIAATGADREALVTAGLALADLTKSAGELALGGIKNYRFGELGVSATYIQCDGISDVKLCEIIDFLRVEREKRGIGLWIFSVYDMIEKTTRVCKIYGDTVEWEDFDGILSRATQIIPKIENEYEKYLKN